MSVPVIKHVLKPLEVTISFQMNYVLNLLSQTHPLGDTTYYSSCTIEQVYSPFHAMTRKAT